MARSASSTTLRIAMHGIFATAAFSMIAADSISTAMAPVRTCNSCFCATPDKISFVSVTRPLCMVSADCCSEYRIRSSQGLSVRKLPPSQARICSGSNKSPDRRCGDSAPAVPQLTRASILCPSKVLAAELAASRPMPHTNPVRCGVRANGVFSSGLA